jgi:hypothetical protein
MELDLALKRILMNSELLEDVTEAFATLSNLIIDL